MEEEEIIDRIEGQFEAGEEYSIEETEMIFVNRLIEQRRCERFEMAREFECCLPVETRRVALSKHVGEDRNVQGISIVGNRPGRWSRRAPHKVGDLDSPDHPRRQTHCSNRGTFQREKARMR